MNLSELEMTHREKISVTGVLTKHVR